MAIFDIYSKRNNPNQFSEAEYKSINQKIRVQIIFIWREALGNYKNPGYGFEPQKSNTYWKMLHNLLAKELGVFTLEDGKNWQEMYENFFLKCETENALDCIEISFRCIDRVIRKLSQYAKDKSGIILNPDEAIGDLNKRFKEHGLGFQYSKGVIVKITSQYTYEKLIDPALTLLTNKKYEGALSEFKKANDEFRKGNNTEAINESLKSFESTMKCILESHKIPFDDNATASILIKTMTANNLIKSELNTQLNSLKSILESGVPTIRNKNTAHGQGLIVKKVPDYLAEYTLNLLASNIIFLVKATS